MMSKRSLLLFFVSLFVALVSSGCDEKQDAVPPFLTIDTKTVNFNSSVSTREISIKTSIDAWTATVQAGAQSWLDVSRSGSILRINVSENNESGSRKGEIKVVAGDLSETIVVEQLGVEPAILLSSDIFTVSTDGGEISLEVTSNIEYDITFSEDATWIKEVEGTRSADMVTKEFHFEIEWNSTDSERRADIIVRQRNGSLENKALVIQKAQEGYSGGSTDDIEGDIKVPISSGYASSSSPSGTIEKSFDNDYGTIYHSNWTNSGANYFPITLEYYFENQESIDYFVYYPRPSGPNGNFKEVEVWASTEDNPTFVKLIDHDFGGSGSAAIKYFDEPIIKPKTIRFVVKSGAGDGQGFASCAEMEFYRINPEKFDPLIIFTDQSCSELKPGVTLDDVSKIPVSLYKNIAYYLLNNQYPGEFRIQEYKAWQHPDDWARENKTSTMSLLDNPTGISVNQGEELIVFVGDTHGYTVSLKIQNLDVPGEDGYDFSSFYPLSTGINKITPRNKGLIYVFYHTKDYDIAPPIKIHFATGKVNGYYDSQKHSVSDWSRLLGAATNKHFDVLGKYAHLVFETSAFRSYASDNGAQLIDAYDDLVRLEMDFMGLMKYERVPVNRAYFQVIYKSYMYATSYRTAYVSTTQQAILTLNSLKTGPWGPAHEMGHTLQTRPGFRWLGMTEVTNNVHSLYVQTEWGNESRIEVENVSGYSNRYEKAYHQAIVNNSPHALIDDVFCKLVSLWQLQLYFSNAKREFDTYKDYYEMVRTSPNKPNAGEQQLDFVRMMCDVTRTDLTDFFANWGYLSPVDATLDDYGSGTIKITQSQIDALISEIKAKGYPVVTDKVEYICDSNWEIYKNKLPVQAGTVSVSGSTITTSGWKNVVAFEVYEGDELIFVSNRNSFTIKSQITSDTEIYAISYNGEKIAVN